MRPPFRAASVAALALLAAACDTSADPPASPPAADAGLFVARTFHVSQAPGALDVRFYAPALEPGERVSVEAGAVRLHSTARADGRHAVSWTGPARSARRVVGVLRGEVQAAFAPGPSPDAGTTEAPPTSVHRRRLCRGGECVEIVEYDYDLTAPSGDGTARWTPPGGTPLAVDRLRFETAGPPTRAVTVTSPDALRLVPGGFTLP